MRLDVVVLLIQLTANIIDDNPKTAQAVLLLPLEASTNSCITKPNGCPDKASDPAKRLASPAQKVTKMAITIQENELTLVEMSSDFGISDFGSSISSAVHMSQPIHQVSWIWKMKSRLTKMRSTVEAAQNAGTVRQAQKGTGPVRPACRGFKGKA